MPVGAAIGGAAVIGGVATSNAANKTSKAATQVADQNNATQLAIYNQNKDAQQPFLQGGNRAWDAWQSFMGLADQPSSGPAQMPANALNGYGTGQPGGSGSYGGRMPSGSLEQRVASMGDGMVYDGAGDGNALSTGQYGQAVAQPEAQAPQAPQAPTNALSGYDQFKQSMNYQGPLNEGYRGLNTKLASQGRLFSGDAGREAIRYGAEYANSFAGDYLSRLMQGTQVGTGAANALAGVGSNYANATSANNNAALNAKANANAATGQAWADGAANIGVGAAYLYGAKGTNALASSYGGGAATPTGYGRPILWG